MDFFPEERYKMSQNIIKSNLLIGKANGEVLQLLGNDSIIENDTSHIIYLTGLKPSIMTFVPQSLEVYFENGKVIDVTRNKTSRKIIINYIEK